MRRHPFRPLHDLARLVIPQFCIHCGQPLVGDERDLCTRCLTQIDWTHSDYGPGNIAEMRLGGLYPFRSAAALMLFRKDSVVQSIVHQIKYHRNDRLALQYGRLLGEMLRQSGRFDDVDALVPVPLHPLKHLRRGYNQSMLLCEGIAREMHLPVLTHNLYRRRYTQSQTRKNRLERQQNMQDVFAVRHPERLQDRHILLVDDILTTGATTAACHAALAAIPGVHLSVAVLAVVTT